eukprot:9039662-Karenia_brevis.AAC.1
MTPLTSGVPWASWPAVDAWEQHRSSKPFSHKASSLKMAAHFVPLEDPCSGGMQIFSKICRHTLEVETSEGY